MDATATWWDSIELWVAGLPFIPQVALVLAVVIPIAVLVARILDRIASEVWKVVRRTRRRVSGPSPERTA